MLYGYQAREPQHRGPIVLREASLSISADDLEVIAAFLAAAAAEIRAGTLRAGGHSHLQDEVPGWSDRHEFDIIVIAPQPANP